MVDYEALGYEELGGFWMIYFIYNNILIIIYIIIYIIINIFHIEKTVKCKNSKC
jgi:hypothetical protein